MKKKENAGMGRFALRGAVAATTATFVLMGGFGAFALWNDEGLGDRADAHITAGRLDIVAVTADEDKGQGWFFGDDVDGVIAADTRIDEIGGFRASPGDSLYFKGEVELVIEGTDLLAQLSVDREHLVTVGAGDGGADPEASARIARQIADGITTEVVMDGEGDIISGTADGSSQIFDVEIAVQFDRRLGNELMGESVVVNLEGMEFTLEQVDADGDTGSADESQ